MDGYRYGEYCGKCGKMLLVGVCPWCFAEDLRSRIEELEAHLATAQETLEFYADKANWDTPPRLPSGSLGRWVPVEADRGYRATKALDKIGGKNER